jgi:hypothetical protein
MTRAVRMGRRLVRPSCIAPPHAAPSVECILVVFVKPHRVLFAFTSQVSTCRPGSCIGEEALLYPYTWKWSARVRGVTAGRVCVQSAPV